MTALKSLMLSVCLAVPVIARAQTQTIEYSKVFSVRHLAGVAMDSTGATVPDVKIEICKEDWSDCFASTTTGTDGRFSVARLPLVNLYYVKVSAPGFDILRIKVHLRSIARKELVMKMHIAA
jgi:hypothetical protein